MTLRHLINSSDLTKTDYDKLINAFNYFVKNGISPDLARGKIVSTLFFQPSTRTMNAFQSTIIRMGGGWIGVTSAEGLSMAKGESFEDTIREYSSFSDLIALRHPDDDSAERASKNSFVPVLNCGSGSREHAVSVPFIIMAMSYYLKKPLQGIKIGIYGTPEINRVSKALLPIFGMYGLDVYVDDLGYFPFPKEVEDKARANGLGGLHYDKLDNFIGEVDMLFLTRGLQKGIIPEGKFSKEKEEIVLEKYKPINKEHMKKMKKDAILYMIKPRIFEIEKDVDSDPRSAYASREPYIEATAALICSFLDIKI